jgi:predicted O-methyltransferase YrrM
VRPLPQALRGRVPERVRRSRRLRPLALRSGLIPPRAMHSAGEAALLAGLAAGRSRAVEIGVYEGSSALVLVKALPVTAELHLIEPFGKGMDWWEPADEGAVRSLVGRAARRRRGPALHWHVTTSERAAQGWERPIDLLFIDGDHSEAACSLDWQLWHGFVEPGGVVAFHDARGGDPGPTAVVERLFEGPRALAGWRIAAECHTLVAVERLPG